MQRFNSSGSAEMFLSTDAALTTFSASDAISCQLNHTACWVITVVATVVRESAQRSCRGPIRLGVQKPVPK